MIITKTPLRISIGGGGTDLPSYYSQHEAFFISAAIDKYVYISLHRTFRPNYIIKYSSLEEVETVDEIQHPIVREAFRSHDIGANIEMVSMADIPSGTGLGSSGSFTVGLLRALFASKRQHVSSYALAEEACSIEIEKLKEPVGKQDQYIASFGGITCFHIDKSGKVEVSPLRVSQTTLHDLEDNLLLFFTGYCRSASGVLADQKQRSEGGDQSMISNLHSIKEMGFQIKGCLEAGRTGEFGELMHEHWQRKLARGGGISLASINEWYDIGKSNGAVGGKLIGAGGGGFLLFYAHDRSALRKAMAEVGLKEVRFSFCFEGSSVLQSM